MKENIDKQMEKLTDKVMKHSVIESPSFDFTENVMSQVIAFEESRVTSYQPLISKRAWILIFVGFFAFLAYVIFVTKPETSDWFNIVDMNTERASKLLNGIQTPRIAAYGVGLLAMMLLIQIPLLKNYFDKRLSI